MRVLFSSTFGIGHVLPMVPLAQACLTAGHEVLWATNGPGCDLLNEASVTTRAAGLAGDALAAAMAPLQAHARTLPGPDRAAAMFPGLFGATLAPPMAADLLVVAREWVPDVMVHEQGELAAPLVAAVLAVPSVTHGFGGAVPREQLAAAGERLADLWREHGQTLPPYAGCFTGPYLDTCPTDVQTVALDHILLRQPMRPVPYAGPEPDALPALVSMTDAGPLVYLTFGTTGVGAGVLAAAVTAVAALDVRVLVTVGPGADPAALGPHPQNVVVERYLPQTAVLRHADLVVSHGGSGTFFAALANGLPQVCLPQAADQFRNAAGGAGSGAALSLTPDAASGPAIGAAVQRALTDPAYRLAAEGIADHIRTMPAPDDVVPVLEQLAGAVAG